MGSARHRWRTYSVAGLPSQGGGTGTDVLLRGAFVNSPWCLDRGDASGIDGLEAAETFAEISKVPAGNNVVESKWLLKWNGDEHGMIHRAKARE